MRDTSDNAQSSRRWPSPPRYILPSVILVLFLGLSILAFLRAGNSLRARFEERYSATARIFNSHLESHLANGYHFDSELQREVEAMCRNHKDIQSLRIIVRGEDGTLISKASNQPSDNSPEISAVEQQVLKTGGTTLDWTKSQMNFVLHVVVPLHGADGSVLGFSSWSIHTAPSAQDKESMFFAVGFVLLLLVMALYYFREFRRMEKYYAEKDRIAVEVRRLSQAVNQSANMVVVTDVQGIIEYVNPRFTQVTGYEAVGALGQPSNLLCSGTHPKEFYQQMWQTIMGKQTWTGQVRNRRRNGELFWERKTISPVLDDRGKIQNYVSVGEDITTELRAQQKIIEKDKMSAVGMLAAGVAHEFKNYLGGIMGNASLALEEIDEPKGLESAREALELVVDLSEKANKVAMSLLTYSRSRPEMVGREDIRTIIEQSLSLVSKEMANREIQVATYFEEVPKLNVSSSKIQQLLLNLLINAAHAVKRDGVITLALFNAGSAIKIVVGDSGSGIPPENLSRVFDPFFSSKGVWGKDDVVGTGMGLPICRNIVREYGGDLTVESISGIGTAFTIVLPIERSVDGSGPIKIPVSGGQRFLIFSVDKGLVSRLHAEASAAGIKLLLVDNIAAVPEDIRDAADLMICDARFPAKGELLRLVEACELAGVPISTIYCEQLEYSLGDMRDRSLIVFESLPSISELSGALEARNSGRAPLTGSRPTASSGACSSA